MAWNRSEVPTKPAKKAPFVLRGTITGVVIVAAAVCVGLFFVLSNGKEEASVRSEPKPSRLLPAVEPANSPSRTTAERKADADDGKLPYWKRSSTNGLSRMELMKWRHRNTPAPHYTNTVFLTRPKADYEIFSTYAENEIANLMTLEPGMMLVGEPHYDKHFEDEFLKSCEEPIVVTEEDTTEQAQLKRDMIEMKKELRERMRNGESLSQILTDAREEAVRLGGIKQSYEHEMRDMLKGAKSRQEAEDIVSACNKVLESQGIAPIKNSPLTERYLKRFFGE